MKYLKQKSLKIGVAPTRRPMYDSKHAYKNRDEILAKVNEICSGINDVEVFDISWLNEEGLLIEVPDVERVAKYFKDNEVDALFIPNVNFGTEEVVGMLGKRMGSLPVLVWGPRDVSPPGGVVARQTDTQCGLFASTKSLMRYGIKYTYIENSPTNSDIFADGFKQFLSTARIVKTFTNMRVAMIGQRPKPFLSMIYNESELIEKFGIETVPINSSSIFNRMDEIFDKDRDVAKEIFDDIRAKMKITDADDEDIMKMAAAEVAIMEACEKHGCVAAALECWSAFPLRFGMVPCFVIADLTDRGLPVGCETDLLGAVTSAMLTAGAHGNTPTFFADLTIRHPDNDNAELLWHCGPFPSSLAKDENDRKLVSWRGFYELKHGDVTIARLDGIGGEYGLFVGEGRGIDGPQTNGGYLWVEVNDWPAWEKKLMEGPYVHHVAAIHGKLQAAMVDACKYINVKPDNMD